DSYFHCIIYGLGPYIADYEEQVLLICIMYGWCPSLIFCTTFSLTPDPNERLIKCTFQDHLVVWVKKYLCKTHSKKGAKCIIDDINQR
ncbi:uncharacterized protein BJ212DRAFT_1272274, partial [Suillus subaureus]